MTEGALIYLSICIGFLAFVGVVGWQVTKYYIKKYNLKD